MVQAESPNTLDVDALQDEIASLDGVRAARVVATPSGRVSEVHLVADGRKPPKQVVRDVQTVALASFGTEIDYRVVSVVQFNGQPIAPQGSHVRPKLVSVTWTTATGHSLCGVTVDVDGEISTGEARGPVTAEGRHRLAATAAADALRGLHGRTLEVGGAAVQDVAGRRVATVVVVSPTGFGEETLVGSALVRADEADAVARAVLDAFGRLTDPA
ncbi:MAG TPA: hypothetical protein VM840_01045 [Actinomycetota bacterium]|nr:hypothetical protein [Actinomycetota bacterium]